MKKINILILITLILFIPLSAFAKIEKKVDSYVVDEAKIISSDTEEYINLYSNFLKDYAKINYYVVTINSIRNDNLEELTNETFDNFHLGRNGLLIIASKQDRSIRVKAGLNISKYMSNEVLEEYIKLYFIPYVETQEWDLAIKNGYTALYKVICNYNNINSDELVVYNGKNFFDKYGSYIIMAIIWLNTMISYKLCQQLVRGLKKKELTTKETINFTMLIFVNIIALFITYMIKPIYLLIVLAFELFSILSNFTSDNNSNKQNKINKQPKRKKVKKEHKKRNISKVNIGDKKSRNIKRY